MGEHGQQVLRQVALGHRAGAGAGREAQLEQFGGGSSIVWLENPSKHPLLRGSSVPAAGGERSPSVFALLGRDQPLLPATNCPAIPAGAGGEAGALLRSTTGSPAAPRPASQPLPIHTRRLRLRACRAGGFEPARQKTEAELASSLAGHRCHHRSLQEIQNRCTSIFCILVSLRVCTRHFSYY